MRMFTYCPHASICNITIRNLVKIECFLVDFVVICDVDPNFSELPNYKFVKWQLKTEILDLSQIDIGIMPSPHGEWELGKAGFKAIQYSGLGAVPVVSATGAGCEVVINGQTGYALENTEEAWSGAISDLLSNPQKMFAMSQKARAHVATHYSLQANTPQFLSLFSERYK